MSKEKTRDKIIKLMIQDSVREMLVRYNLQANSVGDFLEVTTKFSNDLFLEIDKIFNQYGSDNS